MSFAKSFYADQKPADSQPQLQNQQQQNQHAYASAVPKVAPIAEEPLSPAQIQEAIRTYRHMMSNSAPQSPVAYRQQPVERVKPEVHSNYYGGGPTDIPLSYMVDYNNNKSPSTVSTPIQQYHHQPSEPQIPEAELIARLQSLQVQEPPVAAIPPQQKTINTRSQPKQASKMYDDEESGYCFNKKKASGDDQAFPEFQNEQQYEEAEKVYNPAPYKQAPAQTNFRASLGPSEYIGMSNDSKFIYDSQRACPASYTPNNNYTLVNNATAYNPPPPAPETENGTTTTEDVTQVPASPAVPHSRFRGMIQNLASTPTKMTAPIVVERISDSPIYYNQNQHQNYMPSESEYQLPVLNDLASCIEHY